MASQHASSTPLFWGYGSDDHLIRPQLTRDSVDTLETSLGLPRAKAPGAPGLTLALYEGMGHETNLKELDDLKQFIKKYVPKDA